MNFTFHHLHHRYRIPFLGKLYISIYSILPSDTFSNSKMATPAPAGAPPTIEQQADMPPAIVCIGMAGSGKTTFMQRLNAHLHAQKEPPYILNLDPAVKNVAFDVNIDSRTSVDDEEVMRQYVPLFLPHYDLY